MSSDMWRNASTFRSTVVTLSSRIKGGLLGLLYPWRWR